MTNVFVREQRGRCTHREAQREEAKGRQAESGRMLPSAKEHWEPSAAGKVTEDSPLEPLERAWLSQNLDFRLLVSRTVRE